MADLIRALAGRLGDAQVLTRPADLAAYAFDAFGASGDRHLPDAVVFPGSVEDVAACVRLCAEAEVPVVPRGAGTGYSGGAVALHGGVLLNLCRMNRVLGVEAEAMRLHAEAGAITATVHRRAAAAGLYFPPDPGSATTSTLGGNVACNAAGPHALRYGATADWVTGLVAVLADGRIVRLGEGGDGDAASVRLLCGSEGTLAVVAEVLLRLMPAPAHRVTLATTFPGMERATNAVATIAAAGIVPAALEFMDEAALDAVRRSGVQGHVPAGGALVIVEVEGDESTASSEADAVRSALEAAGGSVEVADGAAARARVWATRKAISAAVARVMIGKVNEDVVVPRDRVTELVATTRTLGARHGVPTVIFGHLGDGNLHATFLIDPRRPGDRARADAAAGELFETVLAAGGSLTGEHGVGHAKLAWVERQVGAGGVAMMRRLKDALDPQGLLNPGKKVPPPLGEVVAAPSSAPAAAAAH